MENLFENTMKEIESILKSSPFSDKHFQKSNNIFNKINVIVTEWGLDDIIGKLLWKYLLNLHRGYIQTSFEQKKNSFRLQEFKVSLGNMLIKGCRENNIDENVISHLLCLHKAIWRSLNNQVNEYCKKVTYIESGYTKFKKSGGK
ncbi:MAG: hypothetical protein IKO36_10945 [Bacteroidaceae bacterium]|nr:hypothetical protein [Bacteroidaceae bacterium]